MNLWNLPESSPQYKRKVDSSSAKPHVLHQLSNRGFSSVEKRDGETDEKASATHTPPLDPSDPLHWVITHLWRADNHMLVPLWFPTGQVGRIQTKLPKINRKSDQNHDNSHRYRSDLEIQHQNRYFSQHVDLLIKITETAAKITGTTANLKAGTWISLRDLLFGTMLPSGNDAAFALSEVVGFFLIAEQKCDSMDVLSKLDKINLTCENTGNYVN